MDDDTVFRRKYQQYKMRVKLWEKTFRKKHLRVPSKHDIREAPQEIRDSYKMYYKLKTSFLENTLNDVLCEDGYDVLEISQLEENIDIADAGDDSACESYNGGPKLPLDIAAIVKTNISSSTNDMKFSNLQKLPTANALSHVVNLHQDHAIKDFEAVEQLQSNVNAWGSEVSTNFAVETKTNDSINVEKKPFKSNLHLNLFKSPSFLKRNPRKSLSRHSFDSSVRSSQTNPIDSLSDVRAILPDLETILLQKAKEQQTPTALAANPQLTCVKTKESLKVHLDEGWLNRTAAQNDIKSDDVIIRGTEPNNVPAVVSSIKRQNYGLSNIDVTKIMPNLLTVAVAKDNPPIESIKAISMNEKSKTTFGDSDSDSVVYDSEIEDETKGYRHVAKRRRILPAAEKDVRNETEDLDSNQNYEAIENIKQAKSNTEPISSETRLADDDLDKIPANKKRRQVIAQSWKTNNETKPAIDNSSRDSNARQKYIESDLGEDFSADDEKDVDYAVKKSTKEKRKVAVGKRSKLKRKTETPELSKVKKQSIASKSKKKIEKRTLQKELVNSGETDIVEVLEETEAKPPNSEDLKFILALERGNIKSMPRANISDLAAADDVAQRYISKIAEPASNCVGAKFALYENEKRESDRKKLEGKIAAGKLNENYVTINIQKKKFVRGKTSVNYSTYKKKMWKHKKHVAALTGPDMNMGGCDGGVLKCFACGQVGHFARACKLKGDSLLPLTAHLEEDPSPFPTLEEAGNMASQTAVAVHSRNISKLPSASNFAIYCPDNHRSESESDVEENDVEDILIETDDDLEGMDVDRVITAVENISRPSPVKHYVGHKIPEEFLKKAGLDVMSNSTSAQFGGVGPLYDLKADGTVMDVTSEVLEALRMFGHSSFRKGQDRAIMRILSGLPTLVTLSTGSGKSLCYQLPAYLYSRKKKSITLVISPLVSLMEDQVTGVPHFLRAHCLHTNQTPQQRLKVMQMISDGEIDILLVSPEAVVAGERSTGFGSILRQLPPIAFACIDEAHCVSQWSHNFRPSYLMICKVLKKNLGVQTVLGLTATATLPTRLSIVSHLGISDGERGIISDTPLPSNLLLSVSKDENKDSALLGLLRSKRFDACQSIIIYCTRRDECERVAGFIRSCLQSHKPDTLQDGSNKKRKRVNWQAESYHAGMQASRRRTIQNAFMRNELRIVVATIAFGMGINKPDIRAVIHYNMPRNFESYVQEVGRAGRDGQISHCHLFLDAHGGDQNELRRHVYANSIDRHVIRKLLQRVFVSCSCDKNLKESSLKDSSEQENMMEQFNLDTLAIGLIENASKPRGHICLGHEVGFSIEKTVEALDIPEENISTLLCYMELDPRWNINVLSSAYITAKVISYGGPKYLKHAAKECPPLAMAIAIEIKKNNFKEDSNIIEFSVVDIAAAIGWNSGVVKFQLKNLEWMQVNGYPKRTPINVSFSDLGFRIKVPGDFTTDEIDDALDALYKRSVAQEKAQLIQLQYVFQGLSSVAYTTYLPCSSENFSPIRSNQLKGIIRDYFLNDYPKDLKLEANATRVPDDCVEDDVHAIINMYPENNFSGRTIARIFHGIASPNYPAVMWGRCKYWRAHFKIDFNHIVQLANAVIVKRRT